MLKQLKLTNFRAFKKFTLTFGESAYLVGPNNAGKSTILTAIRTVEVLLRYAYARKPDVAIQHNGSRLLGYPVTLREFPALRDSIRYEFGDAEAALELTWKSGVKLTAVWPEEPDDDDAVNPFFYLTRANGFPVTSIGQARSEFPPLGVIPILSPLEHTEYLIETTTVTRNISGRLSSRHFRNQLRMLQDDGSLNDFIAWARPWLGDIQIDQLSHHMESKGMALDTFYYEDGSRVPKEIAWAGDGIQIWLQLLFHIYRVRDRSTVILDEPEVYLHPDLQRRLVHVLESLDRQVVVATHSAEVVAEADPRLTTLVDKTRTTSRRPKNEADLEMLSATLGTAFNLRLARALRSRVAVFVEGQDMNVLRRFARILNLESLQSHPSVTVVPLGGYSKWGQVEPFKWLCSELLPDAIKVFVILDRDYRPDNQCVEVMDKFQQACISAHIWERKELESYVIQTSVLSRLSGAPESFIDSEIDNITLTMEDAVFGRMLSDRIAYEVGAKTHQVDVMTKFKNEFGVSWKSADFRRRYCPPKQIVADLNKTLQSSGYKPVSMVAVARSHRVSEIPAELADLLREIDAAAHQ
ncbi:putative ATP-dependent endonuclease of OLD family [Kribbella sp. VKM Ac-2569]|nr:putative ATP-dependent endonuclease of OLD family [Kribbella sp. VKM Ac-2569]